MIVRINDIDVKSIEECLNVRKTNKSLLINNTYVVKKQDVITFTCSNCGKESNQTFRFKEKFFHSNILCDSCNRSINNAFRRDDVKNKIKQTNLQRYGVENPMQNKNILEQSHNTQRKNHDGCLAFNSQKQRQTLKEEYGNEVMFKTKHFKQKSKKSLSEKYNVDNPMKSDEIKNKVKKTMKERYGEEIIYKSEYFKEKLKKANLLKYGVEHPMQNEEHKNNIQKIMMKKYGSKTFLTSDAYADMNINVNTSKSHNEIIDFIESSDIANVKKNDRSLIKPQEIDIYIPSHKLAVEFDGLYWHSDKFKDKFYHQEKTHLCEDKDIQLIHVFEDEWADKREIVKARLKNLLGLNSRRVGARQCAIREIDPKTKNGFLNKYHIQGEDHSSVKLGAYYGEELIGVMTFSKPRIFMKKKIVSGVWELSRFATVPDTYTPGLASRMLKHFERAYNPKVIESFADRRWSQGNLYYKLGFNLEYETKPNYFYWKPGNKRYHRFKFRKSELKGFDNYSPDKTEHQIMDEAGWNRIYDCGNYKFTKSL